MIFLHDEIDKKVCSIAHIFGLKQRRNG